MLTVESLLEKLEEFLWTPPYQNGNKQEITVLKDRRFISDVSSYTRGGKPLSTAQSNIVMKLIAKYRNLLIVSGMDGAAIDALVNSPVHRQPPYESKTLRREVRYIGDNKLLMRFKYNPTIIERLREIKSTNPYTRQTTPTFIEINEDTKLWLLEVNDASYPKIVEIIRAFRFEFDDSVVEYFMNFENNLGLPSRAVVNDDTIEVTCLDGFVTEWVKFIGGTNV